MALFDAEQKWLYSYLDIGRGKGIYVPWLLSMSIKKGLLNRFESPLGYHKESPEQVFDAFSKLGLRPYKDERISDEKLHYLCFILLKARTLLNIPFQKIPLRISFVEIVDRFENYHVLDERKALSLLLLERNEIREEYLSSRKGVSLQDQDKESIAFLGAACLMNVLPFRDYEDMFLSYHEGLGSLVMEGEKAIVCPFTSKKELDTLISSPGFPYARRNKEGYLFFAGSSAEAHSVRQTPVNALHGYGLVVLEKGTIYFQKIGFREYKAGLGSLKQVWEFKKHSSAF